MTREARRRDPNALGGGRRVVGNVDHEQLPTGSTRLRLSGYRY